MQNVRQFLTTLFRGSEHGSRSATQDLAVALHNSIGESVMIEDYEIEFVGMAICLVNVADEQSNFDYVQRRTDVQLRILTYINGCVAARNSSSKGA